MTTLREAAQQALEALKVAVDHYHTYHGHPGTQFQQAIDDLDAALARIEWVEPLAQQAEPVEPVAYIHRQGGHWEVSERHLDDGEKARGWTEEPLYTAPPKTEPLTEEEIRDLWSWSMTAEAERTATTQQHAFTRAVERAHGIPMPEAPACPDCHGVGYDASGQLCACQQNPSFG